MSKLRLVDAIGQLRRELAAAIAYGKDEPLQFKLGEVELELQVEASVSGGGNIGVEWLVVSIGGEAKRESTSTHTIRLKLSPEYKGSGDVRVSDASGRPG